MGVCAHVIGSGGIWVDLEPDEYLIRRALGEVEGVGAEAVAALEALYGERRHGMSPISL